MSNEYTKVHPYSKPSFWMDPNQHFWETNFYSEKSKGYFREWVGRINIIVISDFNKGSQNDVWSWLGLGSYEVTHWMPLPEPPKL